MGNYFRMNETTEDSDGNFNELLRLSKGNLLFKQVSLITYSFIGKEYYDNLIKFKKSPKRKLTVKEEGNKRQSKNI